MEAFRDVLHDPRVGEIVIQDDASDMDSFRSVMLRCHHEPKVRLFRNVTNQGVYRNKYHSAVSASLPWVIIFDSDNVIGRDYLDALFALDNWDKSLMYSPDFAKPEFDYRHFGGKVIARHNVANYAKMKKFDCLINTMNCFVNRQAFMEVFDPETEPVAADSIYFNYNWLKRERGIFVVPGMQYEHRIHRGSHFVQNSARSNAFHKGVMNKLTQMR
jgi:glycosyltransferase involved in cell wall biosynthesis